MDVLLNPLTDQNVMITGLMITGLAYLAGSIPFGMIFTRLGGKGDIRNVGSGNIGATNVLRTGSKLLAALTLIFDAGKGALCVLIVASNFEVPLLIAIAGAASVFGHCFPVWLKFKGGKGVATNVAVFSAFDWRLGLIFVGLWLGSAAIMRYSSLAALIATLGCSIAAFWLHLPAPISGAVLVMSALSWVRHHENIGRILSGTETKIGRR
ncbi:glycerol-3-phosphate 1-O-acyltransferase PlsY [Alphaproteobacteria bacterium]|jgi:glycerol-3-phosphate acyltransferase PlsY|nr:glycerol-3-phosphate 1-O-acyltransferase PlsY [Alphaproteobacteria bacterium]